MSTTKQFMVIDTRTMKKTSFESKATTVGELKADLIELGIPLEDMIIQEGLTKTEFKSDEALLPHDVPYKGGTTNNLVFRLTKAEKKIKSGAGMTRQDAYTKVKELGLTELIAKKYGKNFTMCKTAELIAEIEAASGKENEAKRSDVKTAVTGECKAIQAVTLLTNKLVDNGILSLTEGAEVMDILGITLDTEEGTYSSKELDNMFEDM